MSDFLPIPAESLAAQPEEAATEAAKPPPLVSIVIPTHDRPEYLILALKSARAQTYENIEIIISDNSSGTASREAIADQLAADPRVSYSALDGGGYMENWLNGLGQAKGEYVNFLMDDDLFHPQKVERMAHYFTGYPSVSLVTSFRDLIDGAGRPILPILGTHRLFEDDTVVLGNSMAEAMLKQGTNLIGEPTTAMFRRRDIGAGFGRFCNRQYQTMSDTATWMTLLHNRHCVYLPQPLSSFRLHGGQDQRKKSTAINANCEWLQILLDGHQNGLYILKDEDFRALLMLKLTAFLPYLVSEHEEIRNGDYKGEEMQLLIRRAFGYLLQ